MPCPEGIEIGQVIWHVDQVQGRGIDVERYPFDVDIMAKMLEAVTLFEAGAA